MLFYLILRKRQDHRQNWALFYCLIYSFSSMQLANLLCERLGFWSFESSSREFFKIPPETFFIWLIFWSIVPLLKMRLVLSIIFFLVLLWLDVLSMKFFQEILQFKLYENWILGDVLFILLVFTPGYLWAYAFYQNSMLRYRAFMQVFTMILLFYFSIPILLYEMHLIRTLHFNLSISQYQLLFIFAFPGLVAVQNLVTIGKGTPFPYDKTEVLVETGIYAYCKNPIQWSFGLLFIPLSIIHESYYLLLGTCISIIYAYSVSNFQEYQDMEKRFGKGWLKYKSHVPKWYFLFKPQHIPSGVIYFDFDCAMCSQLKNWFLRRSAINLEIENANYFERKLKQVTYVDYLGNEFQSVQALSHALNHINLIYACLGWFINLPILRHVLQIIVDSMSMESSKCEPTT